jgi:basic membrane protein A and related proteins
VQIGRMVLPVTWNWGARYEPSHPLGDLYDPLDCILRLGGCRGSLKVVFVTAEGGLGDHSFNDMINAGLNKAKAELGIEFVVIQPRAVSDFQSSLVRAAGQHVDLVLGASFDMIAPMKAAAAAFPNQKFGIIDVGSDPIAPNVEGAVAKDWEGSALVGVAAAHVQDRVDRLCGGQGYPCHPPVF